MRLLLPGPPASSTESLTQSQGWPPGLGTRSPRLVRREHPGGTGATWRPPRVRRQPFMAYLTRLIRRLLWIEPLPFKEPTDFAQPAETSTTTTPQQSGQTRLAGLAIPASTDASRIEHQQTLPVPMLITPSGRASRSASARHPRTAAPSEIPKVRPASNIWGA